MDIVTPHLRRGFCLVFIVVALVLAAPVIAEERILDFHSDVTVHPDSTMTVTETIVATAEGNKIKRGIYRDFPTRYPVRDGSTVTVGFHVKEVRRNGAPEAYHTSRLQNGVRVYIGQKNVMLSPGQYTYEIVYNTDHQLGFFGDFDELYWNVTGNGWEFPILKASVLIHLPGDAGQKIVQTAAYTGPQGAQGQDFTQSAAAHGISFSTTRPLGEKEGLTIAVAWPKGYVTEPDPLPPGSGDEGGLFGFKPSTGAWKAALVPSAFALVTLLAYYLLVWVQAGKDPESGAIVVRYAPPDSMTPAVMRFIREMGYDDRVFASALIALAVKGHITISESGGDYTLTKKTALKSQMSDEERSLVDNLFGGSSQIELVQTNHRKIRGAIKALSAFLKQRYEKIYFLTNRTLFVVGLLLTALLLAGVGYSSANEAMMLAPFGFICAWLTGWSVGVIAMLRQAGRKWKAAFSRPSGRVLHAAGAFGLTIFSIPFLAGEIFGIFFMTQVSSFVVVLFLLAAIGINWLFFHLLKAPTRSGRALMDRVEGFRTFLAATEKDRLNMMNPPDRTPELFEKFLPYALALGVEQNWSEQFSDVLTASAAEPSQSGYRPLWYSGSYDNASGLLSSLGDSLSSAVSSSSSAPGSSSGSGGGGSSGGGGGGGGGGGW